MLVHNLDLVSDVKGDSNEITLFSREHHELQVIPASHYGSACKLKLSVTNYIHVDTFNVRTLMQNGKLENKNEMVRLNVYILGIGEM